MNNTKTKIVVVGGGFGGISFIKNLSKANVDITLIDKNNYHLFQPLLYQVAGTVLSPSDIAVPLRWIFRKQKNVKVNLDEVISIDTKNHQVICKNFKWNYDYLVLASGLITNFYSNSEWQKHVIALKTLDEALKIRNDILKKFEEAEWIKNEYELEKKMKFVIIGAGATGVELAGVLAEITQSILSREFKNIDTTKTKIVLIEGGNRILSSFHNKISGIAESFLKNMGVEVIKNEIVKNIQKDKVFLENSVIESESIFWTAGIQASPLTQSIDCDKDNLGRIIVKEDCSVPGYENIFAIGDLTNFKPKNNLSKKFETLPGVAQVALQMGKHVSKQIQNDLNNVERKTFNYKDLGEMATIGKSKAVVDILNLRFGGVIAWLIWLFVHLIAITNFKNKLMIFTQWFWGYLTSQRHSRIIR